MMYGSLANDKLPNDNLLDVLQLIRTQNVGSITFFNLIKNFGTAKKALAALPEMARRGGRKTPLIAFERAKAEAEIEQVEKFGAVMILYGSENYPSGLLNIPDPPPIITVRGNVELWKNKQIVAMVGARNASAGGCQLAQKLAKELGENGISVASGLARGIDSFVHKGSLKTGTIAVIAGGIDNIYPPENASLYSQIFEQGAVISEQAYGSLPYAGSFPSRNRIIAGMSLATLVVEASPKSGSLITARLALEYNREVCAIPGSPLDPRSKGCNQLIKQGAVMVESITDILDAINNIGHFKLMENNMEIFNTIPPDINMLEVEMDKLRQIILEKLSSYPVSVDELIEQCNTTAGIMQTILLELELAGSVKRSAGNKVSISYLVL